MGKRSYSVRSRVLLFLFGLLIALLAAFFVSLFYLRQSVNQRILETTAAGTTSRVESLTTSMAESAMSLQRMAAYHPLSTLSGNPSEWYFFYKDLQGTLNMMESSYAPYSGAYYFVYNHRQDYLLRSSLHPMPVYEETELIALLKDPKAFKSYTWQNCTLHGTDYYIYVIRQEDFYIGVYLSAPSMLELFTEASGDNSLFAVLGDGIAFTAMQSPLTADKLAGHPDHLQMNGNYYSLQWFPTAYSFDVVSATLLPYGIASLFLESPFMLLVLLALFLFVPVFYYLMKHELIRPLNYLRFGFSRVAEGDLTFRGQENMFSTEFNEVIQTFNSMLRQIQELKVNYYEEKLLQQEAENRYLRTISYPHFLLNNLNLINNFAYAKNEEGIHTAVMNLSEYLRYFITADSSAHTLKNDVESARCYLNLNCLAYPDRILYDFDVDEELLRLHFPPLVISTIVENCIKHGLVQKETLKISLRLSTDSCREPARSAVLPDGWAGETEELFVFEARNNGPSFPEDVLTLINSTEIPDRNSTHIGLQSVKQTLHSLYGEDCLFRLRNETEGVLVSILIRMDTLLKRETDFGK